MLTQATKRFYAPMARLSYLSPVPRNFCSGGKKKTRTFVLDDMHGPFEINVGLEEFLKGGKDDHQKNTEEMLKKMNEEIQKLKEKVNSNDAEMRSLKGEVNAKVKDLNEDSLLILEEIMTKMGKLPNIEEIEAKLQKAAVDKNQVLQVETFLRQELHLLKEKISTEVEGLKKKMSDLDGRVEDQSVAEFVSDLENDVEKVFSALEEIEKKQEELEERLEDQASEKSLDENSDGEVDSLKERTSRLLQLLGIPECEKGDPSKSMNFLKLADKMLEKAEKELSEALPFMAGKKGQIEDELMQQIEDLRGVLNCSDALSDWKFYELELSQLSSKLTYFVLTYETKTLCRRPELHYAKILRAKLLVDEAIKYVGAVYLHHEEMVNEVM